MTIFSRMTKYSFDINSDLGEGAGQDHVIMPLVSSCNIACGGHFGDEDSMHEAIELAALHKVKIGAHPSYPDRENFGRVSLDISGVDLEESLNRQLTDFYRIANDNNQNVHHIKAHGALYNAISKDEQTAKTYLKVIDDLGVKPRLYVPYNSVIHKLAHSQYDCLFEAFIDRAYNDNLTLVGRNQVNALHKSPENAWNQLYEMVVHKEVKTTNGSMVEIHADTYCIHGDHPNAKQILDYIHQQFSTHKFSIQK